MINWDENIVNDIARRRCVIFIGSGASKNSTNAAGVRPEDWVELLNSFLTLPVFVPKQKVEIKSLLKSKDYLTACEVIKKIIGNEEFNRFMRRKFITPRFSSADIHEHVYNLDSRIVATPNFDKIYDTYATTTSEGTITVKKYYDTDLVEFIRSHESFILKIHGCLDSPNELIFTRKDYAKSRNEHRQFYKVLEALIITHTFIFIGCGVNDPDIRLLLENNAFSHKYGRKHYMIIPNKSLSPNQLEILEDTLNLKFLCYDSANYHSQLTDSLKNLVELVENARKTISEQLNW